jgi:hypothetical protein
MEDIRAASLAFAKDMAALRPRVQAMFDSLELGDFGEFHAALQSDVDHPAFDAVFSSACDDNPHLASTAMREAIRGAAVSSTPGCRPGSERIGEVFVLPVTGLIGDINRMTSDPQSMAALEQMFRDAGVAAPGGRIVLSDTAIRPDFLINATPGILRDLNRSFERFVTSQGTSDDRERLEGDMDDFGTFCCPEFDVVELMGTTTILIVGYYTRQYGLLEQVDMDALTVQISSGDPSEDQSESLGAFSELAGDMTGLEIGLPHYLGRGCAAAAVENIRSMMQAEASCYGNDLSVVGLDGIACAIRGAVTLVEGEIDGQILGPFIFSTRMASYEPEWLSSRLEGMAHSIIPAGRLEYSRSASLN